MKFRISTLSFIFVNILLFQNFIFSQNQIQIPKHANGQPMLNEKFEMLERTLPHIFAQQQNIKVPFSPNISTATLRTDDEVQVGDSDESEFEIHATVNPTNASNIIVGAMNVPDGGAGFDLSFPIYYTNDFGDTWQKSSFDGIVGNGLIAGGGDPMIVFDETGKAYFSWLLITIDAISGQASWGLYYATSTNGGANWTFHGNDPIELSTFMDFLTFSDLESASDKEWMVSDLSPSSPHFGSIYIAYTDLNPQVPSYNIKLKRRQPGANSFDANASILTTQNYSVAQFTSIDVANDGTVYVTFFAGQGGTNYGIYLAKSTDGGATFSTETKISNISFPEIPGASQLIPGISESRLYPCPHIAVDKSGGASDGDIYVTWTARGVDAQVTDGFDIYLVKSTDGGDSWSSPMIVNDDSDSDDHQFYSSIEINGNGIVTMSWYDQRDDDNNENMMNYYFGFSVDGGETFEQFPVSTVGSDFDEINSLNADLGPGEYTQIITTGDYAIPFWADGRTNDGKIAVYASFINLGILGNEFEKVQPVNGKFSFIGPHPNPVESNAIFNLNLKENSSVKILLNDASGKVLEMILDKEMNFGEHQIEVPTQQLPAGKYFVTIYTDFGFSTKKIIRK